MELLIYLIVFLLVLIVSSTTNKLLPFLPLPLVQILLGIVIGLFLPNTDFHLNTELFLALVIEKGIYFAVASGRGFLSLEKLFAAVRDDIIFIAENGSLVEYQGQDLYEATMSREFYLSTFEMLKMSPYVDINKLLLTGKKGSYVLDTVDETY